MSDPGRGGDPATATPASAAPAGQGAAGAALLNERRRQGLSLGDVSRQLKLSVRQVEALERDDYSAYKGPVFIHGFIRNYAKLLGLDPEPLVRATDSILKPQTIPAVAMREPERPRVLAAQRNRLRLWPVAGAVLLIGLALSVYFGGRRTTESVRGPASAVATGDNPVRSKLPTENRAGADIKAGKEKETKPTAESAAKPAAKAPAKPEISSEPKTSVASSAPVEPGGAASVEAAGQMTVRMIFEQESWVEIKDRSGNTIFGQLNPAGSRRRISGEPPLSVVVGNAAGVRLFQGEKSIDLAPHTRVDVARLTLE